MPALAPEAGDDDLVGEQQPADTASANKPADQEKAAEASGYTGPLVEKIVREDSPPVVEFLVGRDDDIELLRSSEFRVAFVTGFGGQGKSALVAQYFADDIATKGFALRIWRDCRERSARFEDQIIAIIEALGAGKAIGAELAKQPMEDLAELFVQLTADAPVLIIFDNVDHYVDLERLQLIGSAGEFIDRLLTLDTASRLILTCRPPIRGDAAPMLTHHLEGLDLDAAKQLFALRRAGSSEDAIARAHVATKGHAFWLDLLAAQVAKRSPVVELDELLQSISEGTGEIPDATLRSIWNSLRPREQVTLQALAEGMRPATLMELADYVRREINYNAVAKAINLLRDLNLVVLKARVGQLDTFELHPLIRTFIQMTFPRQERVPYILAILQTYVAWLAPFLSELGSGNAPEAVARSLEAAELCINAERTEEALERLRTVCKTVRWREPPGEFVRIAVQALRHVIQMGAEAMRISRIVSMTCACGLARPSTPTSQWTLRSAIMPRSTNSACTKSRASSMPCLSLISLGIANSISRASCASLRSSAASTSFQSRSLSRHCSSAPSGSITSLWTTPALFEKSWLRPSRSSCSRSAER